MPRAASQRHNQHKERKGYYCLEGLFPGVVLGFFALQQDLPGTDRNSSGLMFFDTHTFKWGKESSKLIRRAHGGHEGDGGGPGHYIKLYFWVWGCLKSWQRNLLDGLILFFLPSKIMI